MHVLQCFQPHILSYLEFEQALFMTENADIAKSKQQSFKVCSWLNTMPKILPVPKPKWSRICGCVWQQLIIVTHSSTGLGQALTSYYFHIKDLSHWQHLTCTVQYQSRLLQQKQFLQLFFLLVLCLNLSLFSVTSVRTFKVHSSRFFVTRVTSASHAGVERRF